jgi:hypothetical protein
VIILALGVLVITLSQFLVRVIKKDLRFQERLGKVGVGQLGQEALLHEDRDRILGVGQIANGALVEVGKQHGKRRFEHGRDLLHNTHLLLGCAIRKALAVGFDQSLDQRLTFSFSMKRVKQS